MIEPVLGWVSSDCSFQTQLIRLYLLLLRVLVLLHSAPTRVGNAKACFQCGSHGHFAVECPMKQKKNVLIVDVSDESTEPPDGDANYGDHEHVNMSCDVDIHHTSRCMMRWTMTSSVFISSRMIYRYWFPPPFFVFSFLFYLFIVSISSSCPIGIQTPIVPVLGRFLYRGEQIKMVFSLSLRVKP